MLRNGQEQLVLGRIGGALPGAPAGGDCPGPAHTAERGRESGEGMGPPEKGQGSLEEAPGPLVCLQLAVLWRDWHVLQVSASIHSDGLIIEGKWRSHVLEHFLSNRGAKERRTVIQMAAAGLAAFAAGGQGPEPGMRVASRSWTRLGVESPLEPVGGSQPAHILMLAQ